MRALSVFVYNLWDCSLFVKYSCVVALDWMGVGLMFFKLVVHVQAKERI